MIESVTSCVSTAVVETGKLTGFSVATSESTTLDLQSKFLELGTATGMYLNSDTLVMETPGGTDIKSPLEVLLGSMTIIQNVETVLLVIPDILAPFPHVLEFKNGLLVSYNEAFMLEIQVDTGEPGGATGLNQFRLPLVFYGEYDFTVYWGDGNSDHVTAYTSPPITHTYSAGSYTGPIKFLGQLKGWQFAYAGDATKLTSIDNWNDDFIMGTSEGNYFGGCDHLVLNTTKPPNLSQTTNCGAMFSNCPNLGSVSLALWDTSAVNYMYFMFAGSNFNGDISTWDTSAVVDMGGMFYNNSDFNQPIEAWNMSQVTDISSMFYQAHAFNQPLNNWNVQNVFDMHDMFYNAYSFNQPLDKWNTANVHNINNMFQSATSFNGAVNTWNLQNVTQLNYVFYDAVSFNQPVSNWYTGNVIQMKYTFGEAHSFNQSVNTWDVSQVTSLEGTFLSSAFNKPLDSWDVSQVQNMEGLFYNTPFNQDLTTWDVSSLRSIGGMFQNNTVFNGDVTTWTTPVLERTQYAFAGAISFNRDISGWTFDNVFLATGMFEGATAFNQNISVWVVDNAQYLDRMFYGATSFKQDLSSWVPYSVTTMENMFTGVDMNSSPANLSNYTNLLISWGTTYAGSLPDTIKFNGGNSQYTAALAQTSRDNLTLNKFWQIFDGGGV